MSLVSLNIPETSQLDKIKILQDRSSMLARARSFFAERQICEVDCPILSPYASVDTNIDLIPATYSQQHTCYLHSSPEYGMKRLLASGSGDIFQLAHVFRDGEWGVKHNPEFMMAEWYRLNFSFHMMIEETIAFIQLFIGNIPHKIISYRDLFLRYAGFDYLKTSENDIIRYLCNKKIDLYEGIEQESKDNLLNIVLGTVVEPQLGIDELCVLAYYPSSQAALAKVQWHGEEKVAERFEVYYNGVELANGYHELTDHIEQRKRLQEANVERISLGKQSLPIDEAFLTALEMGLPECCGVAVGFDRLMMLRHKKQDIADVIPFGWSLLVK